MTWICEICDWMIDRRGNHCCSLWQYFFRSLLIVNYYSDMCNALSEELTRWDTFVSLRRLKYCCIVWMCERGWSMFRIERKSGLTGRTCFALRVIVIRIEKSCDLKGSIVNFSDGMYGWGYIPARQEATGREWYDIDWDTVEYHDID